MIRRRLRTVRTGLLASRRELADSLYLIALQGVNQLLPLAVLPYLICLPAKYSRGWKVCLCRLLSGRNIYLTRPLNF